jgi:hypothetical protein
MTWDEKIANDKKLWIDSMTEKGHVPILKEDGTLDLFVENNNTHNGPGCSKCSASWCMHCIDPEDIGVCNG